MNQIKKINKILQSYYGIPKQNSKSKPLDILIATILSQNTNDKNSHAAYINLKSKFKTWEEVEKATVSQIAKTIKSAGLQQQKAKTIKAILNRIRAKYHKLNLDFIRDWSNEEIINELTNINGIGVKTASCVLLFGLKRNICPVDTHVFRLVNRIGIVKENSAEKTFYALNKILPSGIAHSFHTNLIKHGRAICKPTNPLCSQCPLKELCEYEQKNIEREVESEIAVNGFMLLDEV
ncbi:MAG: endonuclease III [Ignavibacteria bacterium]|nr:endonuclease III [Ignavibacteria bacterium]